MISIPLIPFFIFLLPVCLTGIRKDFYNCIRVCRFKIITNTEILRNTNIMD